MKLIKLIQEIGDSSLPPYPFSKKKVITGPLAKLGVEHSITKFVTSDGMDYEIALSKGDIGGKKLEYMVGFTNREADGYYNTSSSSVNTGNQYRILSTVIAVLEREMEEDKSEGHIPKRVAFSAFKEKGPDDLRRLNMYMEYVKKKVPNAKSIKVDKEEGEVLIEL